MRGQRGRLWIQLLVFAVLLFAVDRTVRSYARHHFTSFVKVDRALRDLATSPGQDHCIALSGGSDMASAIDANELTAALIAHGVTSPCVADLSIGGTNVDVRFMALREYVQRGGKLDTLVLGFRGLALVDSPLGTPASASELAPGYYIGNNAAVYEWSTLRDLSTYYQGPSFAAIDNSIRFALLRHTGIGANRQAFWLRVNAAEARIGLRPGVATNQFGVVDEFMKMSGEQPPAQTTHWQLGRWYAEILRIAERRNARLFFVKLPALRVAEQSYFANTDSRHSYDDFVDGAARERGGRLVDLSAQPWVEDSLLLDGLHFGARGAVLVSRAMGEALAGAR